MAYSHPEWKKEHNRDHCRYCGARSYTHTAVYDRLTGGTLLASALFWVFYLLIKGSVFAGIGIGILGLFLLSMIVVWITDY